MSKNDICVYAYKKKKKKVLLINFTGTCYILSGCSVGQCSVFSSSL